MPDISQSLQGKDLNFLKNIARIWGIDLKTHDLRSTLKELTQAMSQPTQVMEISESLSLESKTALQELQMAEGKIPWPLFIRKYGDIRIMGAARRERERPDLHPINVTEILWYSGLLGKAFFKTHKEPQEFAYIPDEFQHILSSGNSFKTQKVFAGRPATTLEKQQRTSALDGILDHMTTYLAAIRTGQEPDPLYWKNQTIPLSFLHQLARCANLLDKNGLIQPNPVRQWMEASRAEALHYLFNAWMNSSFNDLHQLPGLIFEGQWQNSPQDTRRFLLNELLSLPMKTWWSLPSFVESIRQNKPDFQRPTGDYDSWYIRKQDSDQYLRGIHYWDEIDGALIRQMITKHLHWLGLMDIAMPEFATQAAAFRFSLWAKDLLADQPPQDFSLETEAIKFLRDGSIRIPRTTSRALRYQISRFCHFENEDKRIYTYRIQPGSLSAAIKSGLKIDQFISLIHRCGEKPVPPSVLTLLDNWKSHGLQANLESVILLKVQQSEIIDKLLASRAKKYISERLNPHTIVVHEKQLKLVMSILAELGYLSALQSPSVVKIVKSNEH